MSKCHYTTLGVSKTATLEEIKEEPLQAMSKPLNGYPKHIPCCRIPSRDPCTTDSYKRPPCGDHIEEEEEAAALAVIVITIPMEVEDSNDPIVDNLVVVVVRRFPWECGICFILDT
jgi:hypothetical protein